MKSDAKWWKRGLVLAVVLLLAGGAYAAWKYTRPRIVTVWVVTDYSFRQKNGDWEKVVATRFDQANQIFANGTGVIFRVVNAGGTDPTANAAGVEQRRAFLDSQATFAADLIVSLAGPVRMPHPLGAYPLTHAVLVADVPGESERRNTLELARALAVVFGAPPEPKGSGTLMTEPPEGNMSARTTGMIHSMRAYNLAEGSRGLDAAWQRRLADAATAAAAPNGPLKPAAVGQMQVANAFGIARQYDKAVPHLREALKVNPDANSIRMDLVSALGQLAKRDEAITECYELLKRDPKNTGARAMLAALLVRHGEEEDAAEEITQAVEIAPNDIGLRLAAGRLWMGVGGGADRAAEQFQAALKIDPNAALAQSGIAAAQSQKQLRTQQLADARKQMQANPNDAKLRHRVAVLEIVLGSFNEASADLLKAIQMDPSNGRAKADLARLRYLLKDYAGAWAAVKDARASGYEPAEGFLTELKRKRPE